MKIFDFNPKSSQKTKRKRKVKGQDRDEESEEEEDQNDSGYEYHDNFDNSNPDYPKSFAERDEEVEKEAEYVQQEDEHENVTPEPTNEQPNPSYDGDFDENPDSNKNPLNSTEGEPFVKQSEPGSKSVPNSSKTKDGNSSKGQGNQKRAGNSNFNASDLFISHGDRRGPQIPPGGHKPHWLQAKQAYGNWIEKKVFYRRPRHVYDCIPAALADDLGLVRLALVFSLGLGEIIAWKLEERILKWSENLIRVFGLGLRWEYYEEYARGFPLPYPNHGSRHDGITEGEKKWQVMAGRLFFQDLLSLVTHDVLDETGKKCYCEMARMLLTSIWARLGNRSDRVNTGGKPIYTVNPYNIYKLHINIKVFFQRMQALV
jgi:hypothetical protein